jgi:nucleotide-binding universal stress UspA family protein
MIQPMKSDIHAIQSIVVTTDLSPEAERAYEMAASLMRKYNCSLTLLACIDTSPQYSEATLGSIDAPLILPPQVSAETYHNLEESLKKSVTAYFESPDARYHIVQAPAAVGHSIVTYLAENKPDLVVMSSHGRSGIMRAFLGSVTEYVLRHCHMPMLVVPIKAR